MGSKRLGLARTQALIENLKRELKMGGTTFTNVATQGTSTATYGGGAVSGTTTPPATRVVELNGEIITTITVNMRNLSASAGGPGTVIGNKEGGVYDAANHRANLITWSTEENGKCYKIEMSCLEAPAIASAVATVTDIDLKANSSVALVQGGNASGQLLVESQGAWAADSTRQVLSGTITDGHSIFLVNGATVTTTNNQQYNAGKYVIKFYGHSDF